jgi:hypothetical protein
LFPFDLDGLGIGPLKNHVRGKNTKKIKENYCTPARRYTIISCCVFFFQAWNQRRVLKGREKLLALLGRIKKNNDLDLAIANVFLPVALAL